MTRWVPLLSYPSPTELPLSSMITIIFPSQNPESWTPWEPQNSPHDPTAPCTERMTKFQHVSNGMRSCPEDDPSPLVNMPAWESSRLSGELSESIYEEWLMTEYVPLITETCPSQVPESHSFEMHSSGRMGPLCPCPCGIPVAGWNPSLITAN